jgi:acetoin utilization protein AcuB
MNIHMNATQTIIVSDFMTRGIVTISMDDTLRTVRERFDTHEFHHLLVMEGRQLIGVVSDRDLLRSISPFVGHDFSERSQDVATLNRRVHQIMSRHLVTASPDMTLEQAAELFLTHKVSCLPVVDEKMHPLGIITWRDVIRLIVGWN